MNNVLIQTSPLAAIVTEATQTVSQLIAASYARNLSRTQVADARLLLESLPLATNDFALARQRLQNADRYLRSGEWGAARYELRLLEGLVRQCLK